MSHSLRTNTLFEQIIREEYDNNRKQLSIVSEDTIPLSGAAGVVNPSKSKYSIKTNSSDPLAITDPFKFNVVKLVTSTHISNPNYKMKNPWKNKKIMDLIRKMGGLPYELSGYEDRFEVVLNQKGIATDRLQISEDGEIWSGQYAGSMNWQAIPTGNPTKLQISVNTITGNVVLGTLQPSGGTAQFTPDQKIVDAYKQIDKKQAADSKAQTAKDIKDREVRIDNLQRVLDWAGFIPVVGDAIDLVNSIGYFYRGKWFDGIFSLIAVIPLYGSFIKLGATTVKGGFKFVTALVKKFPKIKNVDDISELLRYGAPQEIAQAWEQWIRYQLIKPEQGKLAVKFLYKWAWKFSTKKSRAGLAKVLDWVPGINAQQFELGLERSVEFCTKQAEAIKIALKAAESEKVVSKTTDLAVGSSKLFKPADEVAKMVNKGVLKQGWKGIKSGGKKSAMGFLYKLLERGAGTLTSLPTAIRDAVMTGVTRRFIKKYASDTVGLVSLLQTMPGKIQVAKTLSKELLKNPSFRESMQEVFMSWKRALILRNPRVAQWTEDQLWEAFSKRIFLHHSGTKLMRAENMLNVFAKIEEDAMLDVTKIIVDGAIKNGSPIFWEFANDAGQQILSYFYRAPESLSSKELWNELKTNLKSVRKWVDIVTSESEDILEYMYTLTDPSSYYKKGDKRSVPINMLTDPATGKPIAGDNDWIDRTLMSFAKDFINWWTSMADDERNGVIFEYIQEKSLEPARQAIIHDITTNKAGSEAAKIIQREIDRQIQPGKFVVKKVFGTDIGMAGSLGKTKGYDPGAIDIKNTKTYPVR